MKRSFLKTLLIIIVLHFGISMAFAMVFGINHPFNLQYRINDLNPLLASSMSLSFVLYLIVGYIYVIATEKKQNLLRYIIVSSIIITVFLLALWAIVRFLSMNGFPRNIWLIYVLSNYSNAIIYNAILDIDDMHSIILGLTALPPALGLIVGSFLRLISEPQWRKGVRNLEQ